MHIASFRIANFKGIKSATIELPPPGKNSIISLIGLNESGKTTVLEAISNFISGDESISALFQKGATAIPEEGEKTSADEVYQYVPKAQKANFTGEITITAKVVLNSADVYRIIAELNSTHNIQIEADSFVRNVEITRAYKFGDSKYLYAQSYWDVRFNAKFGNQRKPRPVTKAEHEAIWLDAVKAIRTNLPTIVYFPTFLFDFPQKIYLVEHEDETEQNKLYRQVLQDILDSEGSGLDLTKHVVRRIHPDKDKSGQSWSALFAAFNKRDEKKQVDAVLNKMSAHIGKVVFGSWNQIFGRQFKNKRIEARIAIDDSKGELPYLEFIIFDGFTPYYLSERSLGFRWFFSFLLFTQFRTARRTNSPAIFLFDEPASNLHAKAQLQLLKGFPNITGVNASVIYSTHSLYLIEPRYLENAYIVENGALDLEKEDSDSEFAERETDIKCIKYRTFVGQNPDRGSYFQPVIDRLNAVHAPVMLPDDVIIVEGKTDFYFWTTSNGSMVLNRYQYFPARAPVLRTFLYLSRSVSGASF